MCVQENDTFSRKFENGVVLTETNTEHPWRILGKTHEKSKYRQGGFLTVFINQEIIFLKAILQVWIYKALCD